VRQVGHGQHSRIRVYNLETKRVLAGIGANGIDIDDFNAKNTLFLYEPGVSKESIPLTSLRTIATVSPYLNRYNEYSKQPFVVFTHMPKYSLVELLDIGREMREDPDNADIPADLHDLYSDESIRRRYGKFGGSIRRVLPAMLGDEARHQVDLGRIVDDANVLSVRNSMKDMRQLTHSSSYLVQWTATKTLRNSSEIATDDVASDQFKPALWKYDFGELETGWASREAEHKLKLKFAELSLGEIREELRTIYATNPLDPLVASYFEAVAVHAFQEDRKLARKFGMEAQYCDMANDTLYYPPDPQFPGCEAYYKSEDGRLHLVQVKTYGQKSCTNGALASFLSRIGFPIQEPQPLSVELVYCRISSESDWLLKDGNYTKVSSYSYLFGALHEDRLC
jgi:hypothetical protein